MENYHSTIQLNASAASVFKALTNEIPLWWTESFEGISNQADAFFTINFGEGIYKTMQVIDLLPNAKVLWFVKDALIAIPELKNQTEWKGTSILWEMNSGNDIIQLELTHQGLTPAVECYDICIMGWEQFTHSLKLFVETGKGKPFRMS